MEKPSKKELLQRYSTREPKRFLQIEGVKSPADDWNFMQPDEDGFFFQVRPTYELLDGQAGVSIFIDPQMDPRSAERMLKKIVVQLAREWGSLLQGLREDVEMSSGIEGIAESLIRIQGFHLNDFERLVRVAREKLDALPRKLEEDCPFG
jgi:hypothetical protein